MSNSVIQIKNLSKAYMIGHEQQAAVGTMTFRDTLTNIARKPIELITGHQLKKEKFWALKDVNLDIEKGDVVGIIGRNGSGKSTLLKVLSRIVEPTEGEITMHGRVASLLEVGTGFHPELTGRENIYFNGAILGMTRKEIKAKFDEIVAFSEVEKFLDTPVKFYSSGMYVRLAFAVAAHLDPDILIVDEVLAVGDAAFQKKCLGKMKDVAGEGRTVLFVSHNESAIKALCNKVVWMQDGNVRQTSGDVSKMISSYLTSQNTELTSSWKNSAKKLTSDYFLPSRFFLATPKGTIAPSTIENDGEYYVCIEGDILKQDKELTIGYALYNEDGHLIYWSYQTDQEDTSWPNIRQGKVLLKSRFPRRLLNEGYYRLELLTSIRFKQWIFGYDAPSTSIAIRIQGGLSDSSHWTASRPGILANPIKWSIEYENSKK